MYAVHVCYRYISYPHIPLGLLANAYTSLLEGFTCHHMMIKCREKDYLFANNTEFCIKLIALLFMFSVETQISEHAIINTENCFKMF